MRSADKVSNLAASIRQRLLNLARSEGREFQHVLSEFAIERFLYRLSISRHADTFVLKGASLLRIWVREGHRATWDLDLLGRSMRSETVPTLLREICSIQSEDGITFHVDALEVEDIRAQDEYVGVRATLFATLAGARIPMQIDVGLGDAVTPPPQRSLYPASLDLPAAKVLVYSREVVVAEKLEAMLTLGVTNSRMKDFYDVHLLASRFEFDGALLGESIAATLGRRETPIPAATPVALTPEFLNAPERRAQWRAFCRKSRLENAPDSLEATGELLRAFLLPVLEALSQRVEFTLYWWRSGPWINR